MMDNLAIFAALLVIPAVLAGVEQCPQNLARDGKLRVYSSKCYQFVLSHPVDWTHAAQDCKLKGGYLVDIHTPAENYFVYSTLRSLGYVKDAGVWIGLNDRDQESNFQWTHSGMRIDYSNCADGQPGIFGQLEDCIILQGSAGKLLHIDGLVQNGCVHTDYTHWADGQPGTFGLLEDCVILQGSDGKWHDYPCSGFLFSSQRHGWVCKFDAAPLATTMRPIVMTTNTPVMTTKAPVMTTQAPVMTTRAPMVATTTKEIPLYTETVG